MSEELDLSQFSEFIEENESTQAESKKSEQEFIPADKKAENELVTIDQANALTILSTKKGVDELLKSIREKVMQLDGGSMDTATGRKKIRSNAFKAVKSKTFLNKQIDNQVVIVESGIRTQLDQIAALKESKKVLAAGVAEIRAEANKEVDEFEAKIAEAEAAKQEEKRLADWDLAIEQYEAYKAQKMLLDHMEAIIDNFQFDANKAAEAEAKRIADEQREKEIKAEAEKKAEQAKIRHQQELEEAKLAAKESEERAVREAEASAQRAKEAAEKAEKDRIEFEANLKRQAEQKRQAEIAAAEEQRKKDEAEAERQKQAREANIQHRAKISRGAKELLMEHAGLDTSQATEVVKALRDKKILPYAQLNL